MFGALRRDDSQLMTEKPIEPEIVPPLEDRILPIGAAARIEHRRRRRAERERYWLARRFWTICWAAAWWPIVLTIGSFAAFQREHDWEPWVWSWRPLRLNGPMFLQYGGLFASILAGCLLYRLVLRPTIEDPDR